MLKLAIGVLFLLSAISTAQAQSTITPNGSGGYRVYTPPAWDSGTMGGTTTHITPYGDGGYRAYTPPDMYGRGGGSTYVTPNGGGHPGDGLSPHSPDDAVICCGSVAIQI